jgi:sugar phosphate isomerase/epimerase
VVQPKIGLSMLYCLGKPFNTMIKRLAKVNTQYVEVVDDGFHALDKKRVGQLKEAAKSYGISFTVHSPFADINIASPSKQMLNASLKRLKESMLLANMLNAQLWVLHPGVMTGISMFYPGKDWKQNVQSIVGLSKIADEYGVNIGLENMPEKYGFVMKNVQDFARLYRETGLNLGIVLDVGHANLHGGTEQFLNMFADKIVHIHASDNLGESDQHLGVGYGKVDWTGFAEHLKRIEYSKTLVTEAADHVEESMMKLKQLFA